MPVDTERTVAQLVTERPSRARVFERLGVDYCCGGKRSLAVACAEKGLDAATVAAMLDATEEGGGDSDEADWGKASLEALCDHIVGTHHAYLRQELPRVTALVDKVVRAHGDHHSELAETQDLVTAVAAELDAHMLVEEQVIFPACRKLEAEGSSGFPSLGEPIEALEQDHLVTGVALERIRELTRGYAAPADACNTYRAMLEGLESLERDLHRHIHEENNVLFPRAIALEERPPAAA